MVLVRNDVGWKIGGVLQGHYMVITRIGHAKRQGLIALHIHDFNVEEETDRTTIELDASAVGPTESPTTWIINVREFTENMRKLVRSRAMRVRSRRKQGGYIQLQVSIEAASAVEVWAVMDPYVISKHNAQTVLMEGCTYRQDKTTWDRLLRTTVQTSNHMIRESANWVASTDMQATRTAITNLLDRDAQAIGRQWQVQLIDGAWFGRVVTDIIRSLSGHVQVKSTPLDPAITEDVMRRWAYRVDAQASNLALRRDGPTTIMLMSVPQTRVEPLTSTKWRV